MSDKTVLHGTYKRLVSRLTPELKETYMPIGVGVGLETEVTYLAQLLGAEDPYLAVLYPEYLDQILSNTQPDWMESFTDPIDLDG